MIRMRVMSSIDSSVNMADLLLVINASVNVFGFVLLSFSLKILSVVFVFQCDGMTATLEHLFYIVGARY